jgi:hypothetical protein
MTLRFALIPDTDSAEHTLFGKGFNIPSVMIGTANSFE